MKEEGVTTPDSLDTSLQWTDVQWNTTSVRLESQEYPVSLLTCYCACTTDSEPRSGYDNRSVSWVSLKTLSLTCLLGTARKIQSRTDDIINLVLWKTVTYSQSHCDEFYHFIKLLDLTFVL